LPLFLLGYELYGGVIFVFLFGQDLLAFVFVAGYRVHGEFTALIFMGLAVLASSPDQ